MSRLATPIRKNDNVVVITGKDRGKRGRVLKVLPEKNRLVVEGVNIIKRHTKPNPQRNIKGGLVEREAPLHASNVQLVCPECGKPTRLGKQDPRRRPQGPHLPQVRGSGRQMSRLKERYEKEVAPALKKEFGYGNVMAIPKIAEGRRQHGARRSDAEREDRRHRRRRGRAHHRPEAGDHAREEVDRAVQGPQGHADRRDGHAARRAHVGVPRPPDLGRAAARARLPRRVAARASTAAATTRSA